MSKRPSGLSEYINVEKRARQDLSYLFHIPPIAKEAPQEECEGLKLPLFPHQKRSLHRMLELEKNPTLTDLGTFKELHTRGGVVADTVGLGKTAEVISLMVKRGGMPVSRPHGDVVKVRANLVVCPAHLGQSWLTEVDKFSNLKATIVTNSTNHATIADHDVLILPLEYLCSESYIDEYGLFTSLKAKDMMPPNWHRYMFRRVIWDECHDAIFLNSRNLEAFRALQADNVWCVSGTPFPHADSSIFAINALLGIRLRIALTQTPFAMSTSRKIPQSDVFTRLKAKIYLRNTPETVGEELAVAVPSAFPIEGGESGSEGGQAKIPTAGYIEDVFYVDICDVEKAFYNDEAARIGYLLADGSEHPDAWHSKFTKLRMYCSAPLVGSLAADAELDGDDVQLAPLVERDARNRQEGLFRLSLDQLRVHVISEKEKEIDRLVKRREALERDITAARASITWIKKTRRNRVLGEPLDLEELASCRRFRCIGNRDGPSAVWFPERLHNFETWALNWIPGLEQMDAFEATTETWIKKAIEELAAGEKEKADLRKSKDFFKSMSDRMKLLKGFKGDNTGEGAAEGEGKGEQTVDGDAASGSVEDKAEPGADVPFQDEEAKENHPEQQSQKPVDDSKQPICLDSDDGPDPEATLVDKGKGPAAPDGSIAGTQADDDDEEPECCLICMQDLVEVGMLPCAHYTCTNCLDQWIALKGTCPTCRKAATRGQVAVFSIKETPRHIPRLVARYGTKPAALIRMIQANMANKDDPDPRFIVFSQYDRMLHVLAASLKAEGIESVTCRGSRAKKEAALVKFRTSPTCRVLMMSLSNATAAGTNLQNANHVIIVEAASGVNPSHCATVETQAIGRTVRVGRECLVLRDRAILFPLLD